MGTSMGPAQPSSWGGRERKRTHGQVPLLGVKVEYISKRHKKIFWVCLKVTKSQSGQGGKGTCGKGQPYATCAEAQGLYLFTAMGIIHCLIFFKS